MKRRLSFKYFFYSSFIPVLLCVLIGMFIYTYISKMLLSNVEESLTQIAIQGAKTVERDIEGKLFGLETLALAYLAKDEDSFLHEKLIALKADVERTGLKRLSIADVNGNSITTDNANIYIGDRDYFKKAMQGQNNVSDPLKSRVDGTMVLVYAVSIRKDKNIIGVLYATHDVNDLCEMVDDIKLSEHGNTFILNQQGTIVSHRDRTLIENRTNHLRDQQNVPAFKKLLTLEAKMIQGEIGAGDYLYQGEKRYAGYAPIVGNGWSIAVTAPRNEIMKNMDRALVFMMSIAFSLLLIFILIGFYAKILRRKLKNEMVVSNIAIDTANLIVISLELTGRIVEFNKHAEIKTKYTRKEIVGVCSILDIIDTKYRDRARQMLQKIQEGILPKGVEMPIRAKDGSVIYVLWNINTYKAKYNVEAYFEILGIEITERVEFEQKLLQRHEELFRLNSKLAASQEKLMNQYDALVESQESLRKSEERCSRLAYFDLLTGLPNQIQLVDRVEALIAENGEATLLYMDIDNFKFINDNFGRSTGDSLLAEIGTRIAKTVGSENLSARISGDEFAVLLAGIEDIREIDAVCDSLLEALDIHFDMEGLTLNVSSSIGIARIPQDGTSYEEVLKFADIAMNKAKNLGKKTYVYFDMAMKDEIVQKMRMESSLRNALEHHELELYYQAQVHLSTESIIGFEALIRWKSPIYGNVSASKLIEIAEETGLIVPIGRWVLKTACIFAKTIYSMDQDFYVAVNISTIQLMQDDFVDTVLEVLRETGLPYTCLELEITETTLIESFDSSVQKLKELKETGIKISLDDFGKGYSSLNYLKQLPINTLKIDKTFIDDIFLEDQSDHMMGLIVMLAHKLGLRVIAEGVEREEQLRYLVHNHCDMIQGYLISQPLSEDKALELLKENKIHRTYV